MKKRINEKERERESVVQRHNNAQYWYRHLTSVTACTSTQRAQHDLSASNSINNAYSANHDIRVQACISQVHPCCRMIPKSKLTMSQCQTAIFSQFFNLTFISYLRPSLNSYRLISSSKPRMFTYYLLNANAGVLRIHNSRLVKCVTPYGKT